MLVVPKIVPEIGLLPLESKMKATVLLVADKFVRNEEVLAQQVICKRIFDELPWQIRAFYLPEGCLGIRKFEKIGQQLEKDQFVKQNFTQNTDLLLEDSVKAGEFRKLLKDIDDEIFYAEVIKRKNFKHVDQALLKVIHNDLGIPAEKVVETACENEKFCTYFVEKHEKILTPSIRNAVLAKHESQKIFIPWMLDNFGIDVLKNAFSGNITGYVRFRNSAIKLCLDKELKKIIKKVFNLQSKTDGSYFYPYDKVKLINLISEFDDEPSRKSICKELNEMVQKGTYDCNKILKFLLDSIKKTFDIKNLDENYKSVDFTRLPTILVAQKTMKNLQEEGMLPFDDILNKFREMVQYVFKDGFENFLFSEETRLGQANLKTKEIFEKNNLNFETWMNFNPVQSAEGGQINLVKRRPGIHLFLGNYAGTCFAMHKENAYASVVALANTFAQLLEFKSGDKIFGKAVVYFAKESARNICIINSCSLASEHANSAKLRQSFLEFVQKYADATNGQKTEVYVSGNSRSNMVFDDYPVVKKDIKILGKAWEDYYYFDSQKNQCTPSHYIDDYAVCELPLYKIS